MVLYRAPKQNRFNSGQNMNMSSPPKSYASETATKGAPRFQSSAGGDLRIRVSHREYVCDIKGTTPFNCASLAINPGLPTLFPWLAQIASSFESYEFKRLAFEWRTQCSTDDTGKAILAVDFDAEDLPPTGKTQALQQRAKADGPVWQNFELVCSSQDLKKFGPQKYIRSGSEAGDIKTYDIGNLFVVTENCSNTAANGELYVSYDVELMTPSFSNLINEYSCNLAGGGTFAGTVLGAAPTCAGSAVSSLDSSVPGLAATANNQVTFAQVGQYLIDVALQGTGLSALTGAAVPASAGGASPVLVSLAASLANAAGTALRSVFGIEITEPGQAILFTPTDTTVTSSNVRLAAYNVQDLD
jgi:hypothetical protein